MAQNTSSIFRTLSIPDAALTAYHAGKAAMSRQQYEKAISHFDEALSFADAAAIFRARSHEQRGLCQWLLGNYDDAETSFKAALEISDDANQRARARAHLGDVADSRSDHKKALSLYTQALKEGLALNDLLVIGRAQRGLGNLNHRRGNTEQALSHLTQALVAFRQLGHALEQASVLSDIGRTRYARGEYQQAITAHKEALRILEAMAERWRIVSSLNDLGECYQALYAMPDALEAHQRALQLADEQLYGVAAIKPHIQRNLGVDLIESGRYEVGLAYVKQSLLGARNDGDREQEALGLYHLARAFLHRERVDEAEEAVSELSAVAENVDSDRYRALASFVQGEVAFARNDGQTAVSALNEAILRAQSSLDRGMLWKLHAAMSHVVDDASLATVHAEIAADFVRQTAEPLQDDHLKEAFLNAAPVVAVLQAAGADPDSF